MTGRRGVTRPVSVAPMMDHTDRHFRYFLRVISKRILLYTEMITSSALLHGDRDSLLAFDPEERPLVLQLGGDNPRHLAECARMAEDWGYDEVNLNVGCPSPRVKEGSFGACLMLDPRRVADAVAAMRSAVALPVTVKHRIGVDHADSYEHMLAFVDTVAEAGCDRFTVHARKAWLTGLSPKENRTVPPLRHEEVRRLKAERPHLVIETNGGFTSLDAVEAELQWVDAVMIGRAATENPYLLAQVDARFFGGAAAPSRAEVVERMVVYAARTVGHRHNLHAISRHMLGLYAHTPGARTWRRELSTATQRGGGTPETLRAIGAAQAHWLDADGSP